MAQVEPWRAAPAAAGSGGSRQPPFDLLVIDTSTGQRRTIRSHGTDIVSLDLDPSGELLATGDSNGTVRVGRVDGSEPDLSQPPLHTLPHDVLLSKLDSLTNLRVVEDPAAPSGYMIDLAPFPAWTDVPTRSRARARGRSSNMTP